MGVIGSVILDYKLTSRPVAIPQLLVLGLSVRVSVVMGSSHVLQSVVLQLGWCQMLRPIRLVSKPVAGTETLTRTECAQPFTDMFCV